MYTNARSLLQAKLSASSLRTTLGTLLRRLWSRGARIARRRASHPTGKVKVLHCACGVCRADWTALLHFFEFSTGFGIHYNFRQRWSKRVSVRRTVLQQIRHSDNQSEREECHQNHGTLQEREHRDWIRSVAGWLVKVHWIGSQVLRGW